MCRQMHAQYKERAVVVAMTQEVYTGQGMKAMSLRCVGRPPQKWSRRARAKALGSGCPAERT
jgi:hypothetical protein